MRLWQATTSHTRLANIAAQTGFPVEHLPKGLDTEGAFHHAMRFTHLPDGWLLRPVTKNDVQIVWAAVNEAVDQNRLKYPTQTRVTYSRVDDCVRYEDPTHPIAQDVKKTILLHEDAVTTRMVRRMINTVCRKSGGIPIGNEFFVPSEHSATMRAMRSVVGALGDSQVWLLPIYDDDDARDTLSKAYRSSMEDELKDLAEDIEKFSQDTRRNALERRLQEFETIRQRASLYSGMLSVAQEDLLGKVGELERSVAAMLGAKK